MLLIKEDGSSKKGCRGEKRAHCRVHVSLFQGACEETLNSEHLRPFFGPALRFVTPQGALVTCPVGFPFQDAVR